MITLEFCVFLSFSSLQFELEFSSFKPKCRSWHTSFPAVRAPVPPPPEAFLARAGLIAGCLGLPPVPALAKRPVALAGGSCVPFHAPASEAGSRSSLAFSDGHNSKLKG